MAMRLKLPHGIPVDRVYLLTQCYSYSSPDILSYDIGRAGAIRLKVEKIRLETEQEAAFWASAVEKVRRSLTRNGATDATSFEVLKRLVKAESGPYKAEKSFDVEYVDKFKREKLPDWRDNNPEDAYGPAPRPDVDATQEEGRGGQ